MAEFTQAQLDELVAAAIERLDKRAAEQAAAGAASRADREPEPVRVTWDVRSEQTGRRVIVDVPEPVAQAEADRLNAEAREQIGTVPVDNGRALRAGEQLGQPTRYVVVEYQADDERARAQRLEQAIETTRAEVAATEDDPERVQQLGESIEQLEQNVAELTATADEREQAARDALEGVVSADA